AVADDHRAAESLRGIVVRERQPLTGLDLRLLPGVRLHGQVTLGGERRPAPGMTVSLSEQGAELGEVLKGFSDREELVRGAETDEAGRYQLRVGPGRYRLHGPGQGAWEELVLGTEPEVVRDFYLPWLPRGILCGEVRR